MALDQQLISKKLDFALARKGQDLYLWGDQNFNGIFSDDQQVVRKGFFSDTTHKWLGQFDNKIDYSFSVKHTHEPKKDIDLNVELDVYKLARPNHQNYSIELLYSSKGGYQMATWRTGFKRYVAVMENLPVAKFWGMGEEKVYFFPRKGLKQERKIDYANGYVPHDTVRFGKEDWVINTISFRGDTVQLSRTKKRKNITGWNVGGNISGFEARNILSDTLITSGDLLGKKHTVLLFWAFWCGPCRQQIPAYNDLFIAIDKKSTNMLGVIVDETKYLESIRNDISAFKVHWPNVLSELEAGTLTGLAKSYRVESIPTYIIFDNQGTIVYRGGEIEQVKALLLK